MLSAGIVLTRMRYGFNCASIHWYKFGIYILWMLHSRARYLALECCCSCINSESLWYWSSHFNLCTSDMLADGNFIEVDEYITCLYQCLKFSQCFPDINLTFEIVSHKNIILEFLFNKSLNLSMNACYICDLINLLF